MNGLLTAMSADHKTGGRFWKFQKRPPVGYRIYHTPRCSTMGTATCSVALSP